MNTQFEQPNSIDSWKKSDYLVYAYSLKGGSVLLNIGWVYTINFRNTTEVRVMFVQYSFELCWIHCQYIKEYQQVNPGFSADKDYSEVRASQLDLFCFSYQLLQ